MKIRLLTGSLYIAVLAGFFLLKIFIDDLCFDALIYLFALIGTFEMTRAMKEKITKAEKIICFLFAIFTIPLTAIFESDLLFSGGHGALAAGGCFFVFSLLLLILLVARHEETGLESVGVAFLSGVYPTVLLVLLVLCNHFVPEEGTRLYDAAFNSDLAILFIFVLSPFADSLAYVFGRFLKKFFPKKMAPVVSPNKTVIGGIGGLVGGLVGATILYFSYTAICGVKESVGLWLPVYLGVGLLAAVATELGDLVESCIKRKVELKDMGKLLPGHGGILDRIDGTEFATVVVYIVFVVMYLIF